MAGFNGMEFNWVDYLFIAILILSTLAGFVRGLFREILALVVIVAAFVVATLFSNALAVYATGENASPHASSLALAISYGVLFIGTLIAGAIINFFLSLIVQSTILGFGNRLLGAVFGFVRGCIFNLVIVLVVQLTSYGDQDVWKESRLVALFQPTAAWLNSAVSPTLEEMKSKIGGI